MAATNLDWLETTKKLRVVVDSTEIIILTSGSLVPEFTAFGGFFWSFSHC